MFFYSILILLNLIGMSFLFFVYQKQKEINTEILKNTFLLNALVMNLKETIEELETRVGKTENEIKKKK